MTTLEIVRDKHPTSPFDMHMLARLVFTKGGLGPNPKISDSPYRSIFEGLNFYGSFPETGAESACEKFGVAAREFRLFDGGRPIDGVAYCLPTDMLREKITDAQALKCIDGELAMLQQWLDGDVWGYVLKQDGAHVESCFGFYGRSDCEVAGNYALLAFERKAREALMEALLC